MPERADPPAPFRDHERWVAHQQLLYGGAAWLILGLLLAVIGYSVAADALVVVESAETADATTSIQMDVRGPLFGPLVASAIGLMVALRGGRYLVRARRRRDVAAAHNMVDALFMTTVAATIVQVLEKAADRQEADSDA